MGGISRTTITECDSITKELEREPINKRLGAGTAKS